MTEKTGGSAFPRKDGELHKGMTLRDYFAGQALQGLLSSIGEWSSGTPNLPFADRVAEDAYWIADSMLEARDE